MKVAARKATLFLSRDLSEKNVLNTRKIFSYYYEIGTSSGRGAYRKALQADEMVFDARKLLGRLFNIQI